MGDIVIFEGSKSSNDCVLNFVLAHVRSLDQNPLVCVLAEYLKRVGVIAGNYRNLRAIPSRNSVGLNFRRYINHVLQNKILINYSFSLPLLLSHALHLHRFFCSYHRYLIITRHFAHCVRVLSVWVCFHSA